MKIISQFKDYYDYVAHLYGGGDPKIVYNRQRLTNELLYSGSTLYQSIHIAFSDLKENDLPSSPRRTDYGFRWLSVCGKLYLIVDSLISLNPFISPAFEPHIVTEKTDKKLYDEITTTSKYLWTTRRTVWVGIESKSATEISRIIKAPVFLFHSNGREIVVDSAIPRLTNLGMPSLYPAEQLYQDISYFICNTMKDSPDMMPRTEMTDKERILQHGFDLKQSFRHRK